MNKTCDTCKHHLNLERWNYQMEGVTHKKMDGFVCTALACEGTAIWMTGKGNGRCEYYETDI